MQFYNYNSIYITKVLLEENMLATSDNFLLLEKRSFDSMGKPIMK